MVSVKIDYQLKCMNCLYEDPQIQSRTWRNNHSNSDSELKVTYEQASTMLRQLVFDVTCKKCQTNDQLGFLILKANNRIFNILKTQKSKIITNSEADQIFRNAEVGLNPYMESRSAKCTLYICINVSERLTGLSSSDLVRKQNWYLRREVEYGYEKYFEFESLDSDDEEDEDEDEDEYAKIFIPYEKFIGAIFRTLNAALNNPSMTFNIEAMMETSVMNKNEEIIHAYKTVTFERQELLNNSILDLSNEGLVVYYIKDENRSDIDSYILKKIGDKDYLVASLTGVITNSENLKSYHLDIYFDFDILKPIHEQGKDVINPNDEIMGTLRSAHIEKVERFATFKELGWV